MIYFFTGTDTDKIRTKAFAWVAAARAKQSEAPYMRIAADELTESTLAEALGSQGLFFHKSLVLLDDPFALKESGELVLERLSELAKSPNPIAILAPKLLAVRVKKIEIKAEKTFVHDLKEKKEGRGFKGALINALAQKDGPTLWKELQKAYREGDAPEMLHGLLHWKAREMMQKGNPKWGKEGARKLSVELIELMSDSRSGELPLKENLERFALSLR